MGVFYFDWLETDFPLCTGIPRPAPWSTLSSSGCGGGLKSKILTFRFSGVFHRVWSKGTFTFRPRRALFFLRRKIFGTAGDEGSNGGFGPGKDLSLEVYV